MNDTPRPEIYPRYCFHLSPTTNKWCLLYASEVHALDQHAGFEGNICVPCATAPRLTGHH